MSEQRSTLLRMGFSDAAAIEVADKINEISARFTNSADAYDAIIEYLYLNYPHLPLTGNALHVLVGRGTKPVAGDRLTAYRVALHAKVVARMEHPGVPDEFMQRAGQMVADMFQAAQDAALSGFSERAEALEREAAERVRRAEREAVVAKDATQAAQEAQAEAFEAAREANQRREQVVVEMGQLQERLTQLQERLAQSEAAAAQLREDLRTQREEAERQQAGFAQQLDAERAERAREREMHDGQVRFANQQIDAARQETRAIKDRHDASTRERAANDEVQRQLVAQLRAQLERAGKDLEVAHARAVGAESQRDEARQAVQGLRVEVAQIPMLHDQIADLKAELQRRNDQVDHLLAAQTTKQAEKKDESGQGS